jgi:hypothetical protein
MLDDLRPKGLSDAAHALGIDPFELIRIAVGSDVDLGTLTFDDAALVTLTDAGGIEVSWWADAELPKDHNSQRQRVRAALSQLLERGHVGGQGTRMDNVWRGLPRDDQELVREALTGLAEEGLLALNASTSGTRVSVVSSAKDRVRAIAEGSADTSALSALYEA